MIKYLIVLRMKEVSVMGKAMGSWSAVRKYLEQDMLCDSLKGRIRYNCTKYPNTDLEGIFEVFVDGEMIKNFSVESVGREARKLYGKNGGRAEFWGNMRHHQLADSERNEFTDIEFACALEEYRNSDVITSINNQNPIVRMFAVLDRRLGKRTLEKIKNDILSQPEWLRYFYSLRLHSENII